uniref:Uncharacterized protein n=1 Tax=Haptolina ericina TaxID=156174 RepID=A0A7S3AP76_9EUKA|mmetsp:Transcript_26238/g.59534  ORF Transcript_26238/g.59534 Transcript_26238/m.59534 type:complete len:111 (+) Transcript_26238:173-505(+)
MLAWHGSLIHWGGICSRFSTTEPRCALTATLRLREAHATQLQGMQQDNTTLPEIRLHQLPLSLTDRVRYACANIHLYRWWYGLGTGVLPRDLIASGRTEEESRPPPPCTE